MESKSVKNGQERSLMMSKKRVRPSCFGAHFGSDVCRACGHETSCNNKATLELNKKTAKKENKVHKVKSDEGLNVELQKEVQTLRGTIVQMANAKKLPDRFKVVDDVDSPSMFIHDTFTGRQTKVPLYAFGAVRQALGELFNI